MRLIDADKLIEKLRDFKEWENDDGRPIHTMSEIQRIDRCINFAQAEPTAFDADSRTCNCKHNSNSRDNEPCCRCDNRKTNADKIRNMSDEELAELITGSLNFDCADYCDSLTQGCAFNCGKKDREIALKWLRSEAE